MIDPKEPPSSTEPEAQPQDGERRTKWLPGWTKLALLAVAGAVISYSAYYLAKNVIFPKYQAHRIERQISEAGKKRKRNREMGMVYQVKDLTVNTRGSNGRRFAVVEYVIEAHEKKVIDEVRRREPQLRDIYIEYLRRHTAEEILDLTFQDKSKSDLIALTNAQLHSGAVDSLYYTKLIVQ